MKFIITIIISFSMKGSSVDPHPPSREINISTSLYTVALILRRDVVDIPADIFRGAGSIIHSYFAVTAAKCLLLVSDEQITNKLIYVRGNTTVWKRPGVDHLVVKTYAHPFHRQPEDDFNIALLKVKEPFHAKYEHQLQLPKQNFYDGGWLARLSGWGAISKDRAKPRDNLKNILIEIVDRASCRSLYSWQWTPRIFCAGGSAGSYSKPCYYDTGDPVVYKDTLIGLATKSTCGEGLDFYVSIFPLKRWIVGLILTEYHN